LHFGEGINQLIDNALSILNNRQQQQYAQHHPTLKDSKECFIYIISSHINGTQPVYSKPNSISLFFFRGIIDSAKRHSKLTYGHPSLIDAFTADCRRQKAPTNPVK
jgi:hypothetical protein